MYKQNNNKILQKISKKFIKKKISFSDIAQEWLIYKKNTVKQSTYYKYSYIINKYLKTNLNGITLYNLKEYELNKIIQEISKKLSPKTTKEIVNILKAILKYVENTYKINVNINLITSPKVPIKQLEILNTKEKKRLQKQCLKNNTLRSIGILMCLYTGIRIGEICALKWEDIDLSRKTIYINKTLQRVYKEDKKTYIEIGQPKTKSSIRLVPIPNKLYEIIKPLKKNNKKETYFLTGKEDKFIEPRNYQYYFKKCLKQSKIKNYNFHILRHTFATNCIEVGMDVKALSEILGHTSVNITLNRYVHSSYKMKKKYLDKL